MLLVVDVFAVGSCVHVGGSILILCGCDAGGDHKNKINIGGLHFINLRF